MADYFKNKPLRNRSIGVITGLFIACAGAFLIEGMELLDRYTSIMGIRMEDRDYLPFWYAFGVGTIVFYLLRRKVVRDIYNEMESKLDD
jgi:hypothetical protein